MIKAQWFVIHPDGWRPVGEPEALPVRETPKTFFVTLPSGFVLRLKKFYRDGKVKKRWSDFHAGGKIDFTLESGGEDS